jgi:CMP-N-acetylneuraminic acid synthetase
MNQRIVYLNGEFVPEKDAKAKSIRRPQELATDIATSEQAFLHAISEIEKEANRKEFDFRLWY